MAPHSNTLAWKISWTEESGGLQSIGSLSRTRLSDFTFTFHFNALEKEMATHSSVLAWRIPGAGEPGGLPSMGLRKVRHDWSDLAAATAEAYRFRTLNKFQRNQWQSTSKLNYWKLKTVLKAIIEIQSLMYRRKKYLEWQISYQSLCRHAKGSSIVFWGHYRKKSYQLNTTASKYVFQEWRGNQEEGKLGELVQGDKF